MTPEERAAIDAWMAERDIERLADLEAHIADERVSAIEGTPDPAEDILNALPKALATAIEEDADYIVETIARCGNHGRVTVADLWLHAPRIASRLLDNSAVRKVFEDV